jgi:hypothetical protein
MHLIYLISLHSFTGAYSPGWTFGLPFWGFLITHIQTHGRTPLDEWSARRRDLYLHRTTQHINTTNIHALSGIRTSDPSNQAGADHRLRPRDHSDRHYLISLPNRNFLILCLSLYIIRLRTTSVWLSKYVLPCQYESISTHAQMLIFFFCYLKLSFKLIFWSEYTVQMNLHFDHVMRFLCDKCQQYIPIMQLTVI